MKRQMDGDLEAAGRASPADSTQTVTHGVSPESPGKSQRGPGILFARGAVVGRYVILYAIGSGGVGNVYAAFDPQLERNVALKVLRARHLDPGSRRKAQARLLREARVTARLAHPNVVVVHDAGTFGERLFVAMELIDGMTLGEWLSAAPRSRRQILDVFLQAGRGLAAAHEVGLVHRDVKPGNIMVAADGRVRVVDFGLARVTGPQAPKSPAGEAAAASGRPKAGHSSIGSTAGTPAYMAPEQHAGRPADARSDQFSFCLTLFEALYGVPASGERDLQALGHRIARGDPRPASARPQVPAWLRRILARGLAADPEQRFASMDDLVTALGRDTAVRWRRILATAALVLVTVTAVSSLATWRGQQQMLCKGAERRLAGIWDGSRKAESRLAFLATGIGYAGSTWDRAAQGVDAYAAAWVDEHTRACEAARVWGEQTHRILGSRMACLEDRLAELENLSQLLRQPDPRTVRYAPRLIDGLSSLATCRSPRSAELEFPPSHGLVTRARTQQIRARLREAKTLDLYGEFHAALELARAAVEDARELAYRPLEAEALYYRAYVQGRLGLYTEMHADLLEMNSIALATGHDDMVVRSWLMLVLSALRRGDPEEAEIWDRLAAAINQRLGEEKFESQRLFFQGQLAAMQGDYGKAIDSFQASRSGAPDSYRQRGATAINLGEMYLLLGQLAAAERELLAGLESYERGYGTGHPVTAPALNALGELESRRGGFNAALGYYRRALASLVENEDAARHDLSRALQGAGTALVELRRHGEAVPLLERAVELQASQPVDPLLLAKSRFELARALWSETVRRPRALELAQQARDVLTTVGERARTELARVESWLATRSVPL